MDADATRSEAADLLSVAEVAEALGVTRVTVRRWISAGELAATKLGPHATSPLRIPRVSLENLLLENIVEAPA